MRLPQCPHLDRRPPMAEVSYESVASAHHRPSRLEARIYWFALQCEYAKNTFVYASQGLSLDETL